MFRVGHRRKRARQGRTQSEGIASLTAPPVSTVAEEVVMLLRKLHSLPDWNSSINGFVVTIATGKVCSYHSNR